MHPAAQQPGRTRTFFSLVGAVFLTDRTPPVAVPKEKLYVRKCHRAGHNVQEILAALLDILFKKSNALVCSNFLKTFLLLPNFLF